MPLSEDMLILASVWGLRSTIWRRRNPPGDASVVRGSSGSGGSGSFPALGGHASPSLALERTGLVISTDPATLVLMLQRNTLPRAREMMDYNLSIMLEVCVSGRTEKLQMRELQTRSTTLELPSLFCHKGS